MLLAATLSAWGFGFLSRLSIFAQVIKASPVILPACYPLVRKAPTRLFIVRLSCRSRTYLPIIPQAGAAQALSRIVAGLVAMISRQSAGVLISEVIVEVSLTICFGQFRCECSWRSRRLAYEPTSGRHKRIEKRYDVPVDRH